MKILQVTAFFSPVHGGSAEVPYQLSKKMAKRGHQVTIYTSDYKLSRDYMDSVGDVKVHPFKTWSSVANLYITPAIVRKAKEEVRHFDVIHMHNYRTFQNMVVYNYAKKQDIPYVLQAHGSLPRIMSRQRLKQLYDNLWGYKLLEGADRVLAVTREEAEQYKSMEVSEAKIEIVPNGIDLSEFDNLPERGGFRRSHGLGSDQRIILYLGRIDKTKGLDILGKAFANLSSSLNDIKLVIVGPDGGYLPSLKKLIEDLEISDKVLFTGPLYGQEKLNAYVDADVYVLPSLYEIFGITVLEACACGTPVVVTDRCGIADVIDGEAGLVVPYDKEQLQRSLLKMLGDENLRLKLGKKGKTLVSDKFNWEKIAEQIEGVYQAILTDGHFAGADRA